MSVLTDADRQTPTWGRIKEHLAKELERLREANDREDAKPGETSYRRGRIAQIKALLKLDEKPTQESGGTTRY